ncbi:MAG: LysM domain-containing protein [Thermoguttaceae bacterium]|jgi:nucleoid-associated protein YgaU
MNKEAKIGLTIIFVLAIIFIAVVAKRFYSSHAAEQALLAEGKDAERSDAPAKAEKETSDKADKARTAVALAGQPRVITATTAKGKPPQGTASDDDLWNMVPDSGRKKISHGGAAELKPRDSYMPEPPKGEVEDRYDRYKKTDGPGSLEPRQASGIFGDSGGADLRDHGNDLRHDSTNSSTGTGRTYIAAEGDSLFDIARCELGKASRWVEIYDLNADVLGKEIDCLAPGTRIVLPDDNMQKADEFTRRPRMR